MKASIVKALYVLEALEKGASIKDIREAIECSRRQAVRWIDAVDLVHGVERIPGNRVHDGWMYRMVKG